MRGSDSSDPSLTDSPWFVNRAGLIEAIVISVLAFACYFILTSDGNEITTELGQAARRFFEFEKNRQIESTTGYCCGTFVDDQNAASSPDYVFVLELETRPARSADDKASKNWLLWARN